jgi:hypothetical protein
MIRDANTHPFIMLTIYILIRAGALLGSRDRTSIIRSYVKLQPLDLFQIQIGR